MLLALFLLQDLFNTVFCLQCYDSSATFPYSTTECESPNMLCYSEFYVANVSAKLTRHSSQFCAMASDCQKRNITGKCPTLMQLPEKIQHAFLKYRAESDSVDSILDSRFCCCDEDYCNTTSGTSRWDPAMSLLVLCYIHFIVY